ncbi:hypothetical protein CC78DRAFT_549572 [Lojkania enalia]|uniref:DUF7779 domain-containing protein n=1 Tax=Lojkania enalia TaxID=147567 RepID=A0A9P4MUI3_9PLEO|nr:hypothetical protein CC78DRAFT_549572 [Didymosphaeria enalia]
MCWPPAMRSPSPSVTTFFQDRVRDDLRQHTFGSARRNAQCGSTWRSTARATAEKTSLLNQKAGHLRRDEAASNSVLIRWQISFDHIRSKRQSAADLLSLMGFFDRQGIHETLLRSRSGTAHERTTDVTANDGFEGDIITLRDYSFITVTRDANTFEMHSLVQLATRTWLENQGQLDKWRKQFILNLCAELPTGQHED